MKIYELNVGKMMIQLYLMMAVIIFAGAIGQWWITIFALPLFFSAILGVKPKGVITAIPKSKIAWKPAV